MKLLKLSLVLTMLVALVSFKTESADRTASTLFTDVLRHKYAVSSNNDNMVVSMQINTSSGAISNISAYRASDCVLHTNYGIISGGIDYYSGNYYANNLVIDLGFYGTVTLNGLLEIGLSDCDLA